MESAAATSTPSAVDKASSMTALSAKAGPEESLKTYKLLDALRRGDNEKLKAILTNYTPPTSTYGNKHGPGTQQPADTAITSSPLHLAVRCAKVPSIELVLKMCPSVLNHQDARGQTALHLASSLNRPEVVTLLLNEDEINDSLHDLAGKTCYDIAAGHEVANIISISRAQYNEAFQALLSAYAVSPLPDATVTNKIFNGSASQSSGSSNTAHTGRTATAPGQMSNKTAEALYKFINQPRSNLLDFSAREKQTGTTVLHEAARRKDLEIIKLVVARGGDVLCKDRKGKIPLDLAKDDRIKSVLRQTATSEGRALKAAASSDGGAAAPTFILTKPPALRGYLQKWTNMARGYRSRWFVLDNGTLSYYRNQEDEGKASRGAINMAVASIHAPGSDKLKFEVNNKLGKSFPSFWLKASHPVEAMRWVEVLRQNIEFARDSPNGLARSGSGASSIASNDEGSRASRRTSRIDRYEDVSTLPSGAPSFVERDGSVLGDDETFLGEEEDHPPRADDFELLANGTKTHLELTQQLLDSLIVGPIAGSAEDRPTPTRTDSGLGSRPPSVRSAVTSRQSDVKDALRGSLSSLRNMLDEYVDVVAQRERYYVRRYEREMDAKRLWEENMKELATSHAAIEVELQKTSRDNTRRKRALQEVRANLASSSPGLSPRASMSEGTSGKALSQLNEHGKGPLPEQLQNQSLLAAVQSTTTRGRAYSTSLGLSGKNRLRSPTVQLKPEELEQIVDSALAGENEDESDDEEFFEAIESGNIPVSPTTVAPLNEEANKKFMEKIHMTPYKGYEKLRNQLPITKDNRPPVSLWAILKGSIGKDLTKISFPVFFNEPTSMLQRMAEDVEFSECLDAASVDSDPTKRIAFVAAFAMSNYSSTIGRIAKPFNPMLGETFEYVDLKKKYRYISEQVSHHPPISACIAQNPFWEYYGEVDAKSKFLGKSFEIRPTGIAHVKLFLDKDIAPTYPSADSLLPGRVAEHYSWTKVTTSVSNFLFGNPIIDHYGDMVITNHRTGDTCTLTFKPRGWRGSGACEIKGKVVDAKGKEHWDIAGKWDSQLIARRVGHGNGDLQPDIAVPTNGSGETAPEYLLLWKNSVKPPGMPFNLTPFAVTLNDDNADLRSWLPPTDCRLRPDQHAFESGQFEKANDLKTELEEHQRGTRKRREKGELPPHKARWFTRKTDSDTGETYWDAVKDSKGVEYWEERNRVGEAKQGGGSDSHWREVEPIFADF